MPGVRDIAQELLPKRASFPSEFLIIMGVCKCGQPVPQTVDVEVDNYRGQRKLVGSVKALARSRCLKHLPYDDSIGRQHQEDDGKKHSVKRVPIRNCPRRNRLRKREDSRCRLPNHIGGLRPLRPSRFCIQFASKHNKPTMTSETRLSILGGSWLALRPVICVSFFRVRRSCFSRLFMSQHRMYRLKVSPRNVRIQFSGDC